MVRIIHYIYGRVQRLVNVLVMCPSNIGVSPILEINTEGASSWCFDMEFLLLADKNFDNWYYSLKRKAFKKTGFFMVRLTISITVSFSRFLWLCVWPQIMNIYVFWNGFYTSKKQFSSNYWNPQFHHTVPLVDHFLEAGPHFDTNKKGMKDAFSRPFTMR